MALVRLASALPNMHATRESSLIALLNSCVDFAVFDFLRTRVLRWRHEQVTDPAIMHGPAVHDVSPHEQAEGIGAMLVGLNERQREIVIERVLLEMAPIQVAARHGMTRGAVDVACSRAMAKLRRDAGGRER